MHVPRLDRMHAELGVLLEARLWHPDERMAAAAMNTADRRRYLAASLTAKEAWIKAAGRRPPGWVFSDASLTPPGHGAPVNGMFAQDLTATATETGCLHADRRTPHAGQAAWYGVHEEWLIAGAWSAAPVPP